MRLFISVQLNKEFRNALLDMQENMREQGVQGNFTRASNLHITLAFIGEYSDPTEVLEVVNSIDFWPFEISLDGMGAFGDLWWAGVGEGGEDLKALASKLRHALAEAGIPFDRKKFSPHITIVRRARYTEGFVPEEIPKEDKPYMTVDRICLMRSDRTKHGMVYTEIK